MSAMFMNLNLAFLCTCPKKKGLQHIQETEFRHEPQALVI